MDQGVPVHLNQPVGIGAHGFFPLNKRGSRGSDVLFHPVVDDRWFGCADR